MMNVTDVALFMSTLVLVSRGTIFALSTKNTRNLKTSTECLVEQHTGLKLGYKWKPCQKSNWSEQKQSHYNLVATS